MPKQGRRMVYWPQTAVYWPQTAYNSQWPRPTLGPMKCCLCGIGFGPREPCTQLYEYSCRDHAESRYDCQLCRYDNWRPTYDEDAQFYIRHALLSDKTWCHYELDTRLAAVCHAECYDQFSSRIQGGNVPEAFWRAMLWRWIPDAGSPVDVEPVYGYGTVFRYAVQACGLTQLQQLPPELVRSITGHFEASAFHRAVCWAYVEHWAAAMVAEPVTLGLNQVISWERGQSPALDESMDTPTQYATATVVRMAFDSCGLRSIERLEAVQKDEAKDSYMVKYVVESLADLIGFRVKFQGPLARLRRVNRQEYNESEERIRHDIKRTRAAQVRLRVWDMPWPPTAAGCIPLDLKLKGGQSLSTISFEGCRGITLFMHDNGSIANLHVHTLDKPTARMTLEAVAMDMRESLCWIYVPVGDGDEILSIAWRQNWGYSNVLIKLAVAGDVTIRNKPGQKEVMTCVIRPRTLIYMTTIQQDSKGKSKQVMRFLGGESQEYRGAVLRVAAFPYGHGESLPFGKARYASAPLQDVACIWVYYKGDDDPEHCTGMMLEYTNGARRAVGQCRVGEQRVVECREPKWICCEQEVLFGFDDRRETYLTLVRVLGAGQEHEDGWGVCNELTGKGELRVWFNEHSFMVAVNE